MAMPDLPLLPAPPAGDDPYGGLPVASSGGGISMSQVLAISLAYWKQSLAIGFVVFAALATYVITKPKSYFATATLLVNYQVNDPIGGKEFPLALLGNYMSTQVELISSPVVLLPVVDKLKLYQDRKYVGQPVGDRETLRNAAEKVIAEGLTVAQGRYGSQLISIIYKSYSGVDAAAVANAIAEVYVNREYQGDSAPGERMQVYSAQLAELKTKLDDAQSALADFYRRTGLISGEAGNDADAAALATLEAKLLDAQNARRIAEVAASTGVGGQTAGGQTILPTLRQQLATQQAKMNELRQSLGARHPEVVELQTQIESTRKTIEEETARAASANTTDLSAAQQLEGKIRGAIAAQRAKIISTGKLREERDRLRQEVESAQALYRRAVDSYEELKRTSTSNYNNVSLLARAVPPTKANSSRTRVGLVIALVLGGGVGVVLPLVWGFVFRRVRCRDDLEKSFGIPVLVEFTRVSDQALT